ncbi:lipoprotein [Catenovulum agarivorans DS-2]|uniref:Lipoprotein n=1 Tax=Catenovulum agarivorans DS-2 TaxID=1328313 RepID=W7QAS6_9ALTE|nr:FlgO family outer membrane protein [Catenovulum agarivorans]EWH09939.1 lipoprotein [Catenovulum agarivorans DS-2]
MKKSKIITPFVSLLALSACQITTPWQAQDSIEAQTDKTLLLENFNGHQDPALLNHWARDPHRFLNQQNSHIRSDTRLAISDYVEAMAIKLIKNMRYVTDKTPVAVASFVPVDSNLEETNLFGIHLAESFQHQAMVLGLSVVDYKATGTIRVTETGDFALSRDIDELRQWHPIEYVLTGTFTYKDNGVEVVARMVGIESRAIVASSQGFIPHNVAQQLMSSKQKDGIKLVKE